MYISVKLPLTEDADLFDVYKLLSVPIVIDDKRVETSKINVENNDLAISRNKMFYASLHEDQYQSCIGDMYKRCDHFMFTRNSDTPSCEYALFKGNSEQVSNYCETSIFTDKIQSVVLTIEPSKYFISSIEETWFQTCGNNMPVFMESCKHCIIILPCGCGLKSNSMSSPEFFGMSKYI